MLFFTLSIVTFTSVLRRYGCDSTLRTFFLFDISFSKPLIDALQLPTEENAGQREEASLAKLCSAYSFRGCDGARNLFWSLGWFNEESGLKESTRVGFRMFSNLPDTFFTFCNLTDKFLIKSMVSIAKK